MGVAGQENSLREAGAGAQVDRSPSGHGRPPYTLGSLSERRDIPDALRDAVERTVKATVDRRARAQDAVGEFADTVDSVVKGAEKNITRSRNTVRAAVEERLPATQDDLKEIRAEMKRIAKRLDALEAGGARPARPSRGPNRGHRRPRARPSADVAGRRVLITGVGSAIGSGLARRLEADPQFEHVAGLDVRRPAVSLGRTKYIEADVRDPEIATSCRARRSTPWSTTRSCADRALACPAARCTTST